MPDEDPAEVMPIDRERDGVGEEPRPIEQGPEQEFPVLEPLSADDP